jgi:hypothetical protein
MKQFTTGSGSEVQKWLRQHSKDFYSADFDALVKQWDKCTNVGGEYVKKYFFLDSNITSFTFISICDLFTDPLWEPPTLNKALTNHRLGTLCC